MGNRVVILGGGPGGYVAALRCAQLGAQVTVVEGDNLGGTCLNRGCIPSKILKTTADHLEWMRHAKEFGISFSGEMRLDLREVQARKKRILQLEQRGIEGLLKRHGVILIRGWGRIEGKGRLSIQGETGNNQKLSWDHLILATGSRPTALPGFPFDGNRFLSSDDALTLEAAPSSLLIVGGGVIGCEFASIFASFGTQVVLVEALDRLLPLPSVDESCSKTLLREMKKRKIQCYTGYVVKDAEKTEGGLTARLVPSPFLETGPQPPSPKELHVDGMLVCVGRRPTTEDLGLETIGLKVDAKGWIPVDARMATAVPGVSAIGDLLGPEKVMLAHMASAEGLVAAENALGGNQKVNYNTVPGAIFTTPEVANVGLTESQARNQGIQIHTETVLFRTNSKAHVMGEIAGQAKIVSEEGTGRILGVHMVGPRVTDLIAEGTLAVQMNCTVDQLARTIHAHPTLSEIMVETAYKVLERPIHG